MKKRSIRRSHTVSQSSKRGTRMQRMFIWIFVGLLAIYGFILFLEVLHNLPLWIPEIGYI